MSEKNQKNSKDIGRFKYSILAVLITISLNAEKIGLLPFESENVENSITETIHQLIEYELSSCGNMVVPPDEIEKNLGKKVKCYNKECAAEIGTRLGLEKVIFGSLTKTSEKYFISAVVVESQTEEIVFDDTVNSKTVEDLDICVSRLIKSFKEDKNIKKTAADGQTTEEDIIEDKKEMKSLFAWGGGFGAVMPIVGLDNAPNIGALLSIKGWFEKGNFALVPDLQLIVCLNEWGFADNSFDVSLFYFFSKTNVSPFISMGAGIKTIATDTYIDRTGYEMANYTTPISLEFGVGFVKFKNENSRIVLEARTSTFLDKMGDIEGPHLTLSLNLSFLFSKEKFGCFLL